MSDRTPSAASRRIRSRYVVTPEGVRDCVVEIADGRIVALTPTGDATPAGVQDLGDLWLLPGLVDTHVHLNDPGRAEWEGFGSGTRAAAAGGVTTLVDMPLNSVPATCTAVAFGKKLRTAYGHCHVDVAFWGGVVPGNAGDLEPQVIGGVRGFKCFLAPSGVDEFPSVGESDLRLAMPIVARLGLPLLVHAEDPGTLAAAATRVTGHDPSLYATWLASRPPEAEVGGIAMLVRLARETGCRVHVVHVSAAESLPLLREARAAGVPITAETCPHYLVFEAEGIGRGATAFKCAPPIRERAHREALWAALRDGTLDLIATDHSPCLPEMKLPAEGDVLRAWGGIASLELALPAVWTEAQLRGVSLPDLARWMSAAPARLAGLEECKGAIAVGHDADLVAFDPDAIGLVEPAKLHQRHPITPYAGRTLCGRVVAVWLRGSAVVRDGKVARKATGRMVL